MSSSRPLRAYSWSKKWAERWKAHGWQAGTPMSMQILLLWETTDRETCAYFPSHLNGGIAEINRYDIDKRT